MFSNDKTKRMLWNWLLARGVLATLLVFFAPLFITQLEWVDKPWASAFADDEGDSPVAYLPPTTSVNPQSMIVMSKDHQLFLKAYTDWGDIDGDGQIDSTFNPEIKYYGYFDAGSCYKYNKVKKREGDDKKDVKKGVFEPSGSAGDDYSCKGKEWSGNLLNWATMTRMDILRKVLYGGKRYRDNDKDSVILERAFLPHDAHSFTKLIMDSNIIKKYTPFRGKEAKNSITFCNTTHYVGDLYSQQVEAPPLLRVAEGAWENWAANEIWQCVWREEYTKNGYGYELSEIVKNARPVKGADGLGEKDYHVFVEVCTGNDSINCDNYSDSDENKPVGLLHEYAKTIDFGLISGSYKNNKSGGVLRSNIKSFSEEFDAETGVFSAGEQEDRIVRNIDAFRISGYNYNFGWYNDGDKSGDNCPWGQESFEEGSCSNWGNPFAEMTLEALRYLTGADSFTEAYGEGITQTEDVDGVDYVATDYIEGLTSPAWESDIEDSWCAAQSMILINSSESSFDSFVTPDDDVIESWDYADLNKIEAATDAAGAAEGLSGAYFFGVGDNNNDELCTAKELNGLSEAQGICPGAPRLEGSYYVAGLSKLAHENPVVKNPEDPGEGSAIDTYAVRLSANLPLIEVLGENNTPVATLVPACENTGVTGGARCAIVDFRQDENNPQKFQIAWEDSEFGGDYDSDLRMELSYDYDASTQRLVVTTDVLFASTSKDDGQMGVGYVISGGSQRYESAEYKTIVDDDSDGFIAHSGIFNYKSSLCAELVNGCQDIDGPSSQFYKIGGSTSASVLPPPLYFAGKYGNDDVTEAYFEVGNVSQLVTSLQNVFDEVLKSTDRTGAGLGYSTNVENFIYQTIYNNNNNDGWSGDVVAYKTNFLGTDKEEAWRASEEIPVSRTIITWNAEDGSGAAFDHNDNFEDFTDDKLSENEVNDIRALPLGDIIGSKPFVVGKPDSYYVPGSAGDTTYIDFIGLFQDRTPMVYVGANDGMLHGFDAETGEEQLAYVPGLLLDSVDELTESDYEHRFYVDGSPAVLDARFGGEWHSVLASGLGAGGRGLFALNVTDPDEFTETNADKITLFEYGPSRENDLFDGDEDSHIGHIYGPPTIAQMENGKYAVVFGNGYFSDSGKAALYIIYLDGAADGSILESDIIRLVPSGSTNSGGNGLSTASLVDRDRNGRMDTAYAGDLQGNLWRFDLSDEEDSDWQDSINRLFTSRQASGDGEDEDGEDDEQEVNDVVSPVITTGVAVGRHPKRGLIVFFGTGSAPGRGIPTSEDRDAIDGFYAVSDVISQNPAATGLPLTRDDLLERERIDISGISYFSGSENIDDKEGWYMDFPANERVVDKPLLQGELIAFSTLIPGRGFCGAEDEGYLYKLNAFSGTAFNIPVLDINGDGVINDEDTISIGDNQFVPVAIKTEGAVFTPTSGGDAVNTQAKLSNFLPLSMPTGLISWRELVN